MSSVSQWIVREYFEALGFLVNQPCKYTGPDRKKRPEEESDLLVYHPLVREQRIPAGVLWTRAELKSVAVGVVGVCGWHSERLYPAMLERIPAIVRFAADGAVRQTARRLGVSAVVKILCLPELPASAELRAGSLALLKEKGVDGVLLFRTMLIELADFVDKHRNYDKSDLLQVIRILKNYDLLKDPQLELFPARVRRRKASAQDSASAPTPEQKPDE